MNADITAVANALVYRGELRCGSESVAAASLQLPKALPPAQTPQWLQQVLQPMHPADCHCIATRPCSF